MFRPKMPGTLIAIVIILLLVGCVDASATPTAPGDLVLATLVPQSSPTPSPTPKPPVVQTPISGFGPTIYKVLLRPSISKPTVNVPYADPQFGSRVIRISDAHTAKMPGIVPEYSKREAWNVNESLLLLHTGDSVRLLYDGNTYQFKKTLNDVNGQDIFWHPTDPALIIFNDDNTLYSYNVNNGEKKKLYTFTDYKFVGTRAEGNLSRDGRYYAFVGQSFDPATQEYPFRDIGVFDLVLGQIVGKQALPKKIDSFDWISISPSGNFVVVDYADNVADRFHGLEVYDRNFKLIWQKPLGAGHSDLAVDVDGNDVLVMDVYNPLSNTTFIKKFRLFDGRETALIELSALFDLHISCRNEKRQGWCFISTFDYVDRLTDDPRTWLTMEDEIFALNLSGSGEVQRIAHHHSRRFSPTTPDSDHSVYWAEPHATVSRNGDRILFGSNWEQNVEEEASVDTYVIDLRK